MQIGIFRRFLLLSLVPAFSILAFPQDQPQRDSQALLLLQQCAATSGMDAAGVIPDIVAEGTVVPANPDAPSRSLVLKSKGTDQVRADYVVGSKQESQVVNRGRGFTVRDDKKGDLALHLTEYFRPEHLPGVLCTIDIGRRNLEIKYLGIESVRGVSAHHIAFNAVAPPVKNPESIVEAVHQFDPIISNFEIYLDAKTLLVVKTSTFAFSPDAIQNRSVWETYYSDYKQVGTVLLPRHMEHYIAGTKLDDLTFTNIRTDIPVSASDFESQ